jgi:hypothetical protein
LTVKVFEAGKYVGHIVWRSCGWYEFVAYEHYRATGKAALMAEVCAATEGALADKLRAAGLEVRED